MQTHKDEFKAALVVVRKNFLQEMTNLEGIHIGSSYVNKDEIILRVSNAAIEIRDFVQYGLNLVEFIADGGTFEQFVDNELEFIAQFDKSGYDKKSKEHWLKLLEKLYPEVGEQLDEQSK